MTWRYRFRYSSGLASVRVILLAMAALTAVGCGSPTDARAPRIERSYDVHWHDAASAQPVHYAIDRIVFHDGRWRVRATVTNSTKEPLFEATWSPPGETRGCWIHPVV